MTQSINYGGNAAIIVTTVNDGFTFKAWYYNGVPITNETHIDDIEQVVVNNEDMKLELYNITANISGITAEFNNNMVNVEANANPSEGGTINIESFNE